MFPLNTHRHGQRTVQAPQIYPFDAHQTGSGLFAHPAGRPTDGNGLPDRELAPASGRVHASVASAFSTLPTPLLATLALMLVCLLAVAGEHVRKRIRARRAD